MAMKLHLDGDLKIRRRRPSVGLPTSGVESADLQLEREDWTRFRTLDGCCARAGVHREDLARLVAKELVDNALDAASGVVVGFLHSDEVSGFFVQDDGPGLGDPEEIARLFSIGRPMVSSKLWRLPTRGALGNGLRVVAGVVLASGGRLIVRTNGCSLEIVPREDGHSDVTVLGEWSGDGTRVEVELGSSVDVCPDALDWANLALRLAVGTSYRGHPNAWCFGTDAFAELCSAVPPDWSVRGFVECFDGCSGRRASQIARAWLKRKLGELDSNDVRRLHEGLLRAAKSIAPRRLGAVGRFEGWEYRKASGEYERDGAWLPYCVEVWARAADETSVTAAVNRSPVAGDGLRCHHEKTLLDVWGLGLSHDVAAPKRPFELIVNITSPYLPMTTDGKSPDLSPVAGRVVDTIGKAAKAATRSSSQPREVTQKDLVLELLDEAIRHTSSDGEHLFSQRQLFYAVRQLDGRLAALDYKNYQKIITDHETSEGEIAGMYRDDRGTLYHPHTGDLITVGTISVREYERPPWTFNKILYIEKEGLFEILIKAKWPERHECALLTSKGQATRAARDLIDILGESGEPSTFYCIHDADADGTLIYQALTDATAARPARKVYVRNLGLEPAEAREMGLTVEPVERKKRYAAVARYVDSEDADWLQTHRVELNAMRPEDLIAWLDAKMRTEPGKVVPPKSVLFAEATAKLEERVRERVQKAILAESNADDRIADELNRLRSKLKRHALVRLVRNALKELPEQNWRSPVDATVSDIIRKAK